MKKIETVIRVDAVERVWRAVRKAGAIVATVSEARVFYREPSQKGAHRETFGEALFEYKTKLEVIVPESLVWPAISAITDGAGSNRASDEKIFVTPLEKGTNIGTIEIEEEVLNRLR